MKVSKWYFRKRTFELREIMINTLLKQNKIPYKIELNNSTYEINSTYVIYDIINDKPIHRSWGSDINEALAWLVTYYEDEEELENREFILERLDYVISQYKYISFDDIEAGNEILDCIKKYGYAIRAI